MIEFNIGEVEYRAAKLDTFAQLHVSTRIAGILPQVAIAFLAVNGAMIASARQDLEGKELNVAAVAALLSNGDIATVISACEPAAKALAAMPDADLDFVFHTCLSVVVRKQGPLWSNVWSASAKTLMFADIELPQMSTIVWRVLRDSLGSFMPGLSAKAPASGPPLP